jgi:hypothetical protein
MFRGTRSAGPGRAVTGWALVSVLVSLLLAATACEDLSSTSPTAAVVAETATTATIPVAATQSVPDVSATTTVPPSALADEPPAVLLDEGDYGREVRLQVGDRVRIELKPTVDDRVSSVEWKYEALIVQEKDSGSSKVSDRVVGCWLELEALATGRVTVRVGYEDIYGTLRIEWVGYLEVTD